MRKAIIFDLDGTLIDSAVIIIDIINAMRGSRQCQPVTLASIRPHLSKGGTALVAGALAEAARDAETDLTMFRELYANIDQNASILYDEVERALDALHGTGLTLAVCTNKPDHLATKALDATGLSRFFNVVVAAGNGIPAKPDPSPLFEVCRLLGVAPGETLLVGDSEADAEAARRAGVPFVFASYGYPVGDPALIDCIHRIKCMSELPTLVGTMFASSTLGELA